MMRFLSVLAAALVAGCSADSFVTASDGGSDGGGGAPDGASPSDAGGGSEGGDGATGSPCSATHTVCVDFEDGVFPPARRDRSRFRAAAGTSLGSRST